MCFDGIQPREAVERTEQLKPESCAPFDMLQVMEVVRQVLDADGQGHIDKAMPTKQVYLARLLRPQLCELLAGCFGLKVHYLRRSARAVVK